MKTMNFYTPQGLKKPFLCSDRTNELLRAKDDLLSEGGQSLSPREGETERRGWERKRRKGRDGKDNLHPTLFLGLDTPISSSVTQTAGENIWRPEKCEHVCQLQNYVKIIIKEVALDR